MQEKFKDAIFEFIKQVSNLEKINSIILFGSVAKEEATKESDIDFLIIVSGLKTDKDLENKILKISHDVENKFNKKIQVIVKTQNLEDLDHSMIKEISSEGILLYGNPIKIQSKNIELESYSIIIYSLSNLKQSEKMKFKRAMFGSKSVFIGKKKEYKTIQKGFLEEYGGAKLGRGAVILQSIYKKTIIRQFNYFKIKYKIFIIFGDKNLIDWIYK